MLGEGGGALTLWFGCHRPPDHGAAACWPGITHFEIFAAHSADGGRHWALSSEHSPPSPDFSASRSRDAFDGRFVSTPCVVTAPASAGRPARRLMYYSARDCGQLSGTNRYGV